MGKKNNNTIKKIIILITSTFLFLLVGSAAYVGYSLSKLSRNAVDIEEKISRENNTTNNLISVHKKKNNFVNILVAGVDVGNIGKNGKRVSKRTDTILLLNYNMDTEKMNLISIPRDTYIEINNSPQKINAAHVYGGITYLIDAVEKLLDINVNYYGKVDYSGFRDIIDAIGGIEIEVPRRMDYDDPTQNLHIHLKRGLQHLDGKKAEGFFRWRKNNNGTGLADGDLGRIENQHKFIEKVFEKVKSPSIIPKIPNLLNKIPDYVQTNMNVDEIIKYGWKLSKVDKNNLNMITLKGDTGYVNGLSYFFYDEAKNTEILKLIHGEDFKYVNKDGYKVKIVNCTKKPGLARDFSKFIENEGYTNTFLVNGQKEDESKIIFNGVNKEIISIIENDFNISKKEIYSSTKEKFDIIVLLGNDHNYIN